MLLVLGFWILMPGFSLYLHCRKVYSILSVQLLVTVGFIGLFLYHEGVKTWTRENPAFLFASLGVYIVTILAMACCEGVRRKAPTNFIFLSIFTLATGVIVGAGSSTYG
jgi:FtsH-binding integral membrane protein